MKISIAEYAKLCKVSKTVIYNRIEDKMIIPVKDRKTGLFFIDTKKYPPMGARNAGRPVIKFII